jgi:hypothetical protein
MCVRCCDVLCVCACVCAACVRMCLKAMCVHVLCRVLRVCCVCDVCVRVRVHVLCRVRACVHVWGRGLLSGRSTWQHSRRPHHCTHGHPCARKHALSTRVAAAPAACLRPAGPPAHEPPSVDRSQHAHAAAVRLPQRRKVVAHEQAVARGWVAAWLHGCMAAWLLSCCAASPTSESRRSCTSWLSCTCLWRNALGAWGLRGGERRCTCRTGGVCASAGAGSGRSTLVSLPARARTRLTPCRHDVTHLRA